MRMPKSLILKSFEINDIKKDLIYLFDNSLNGTDGNEYWELCSEAQKHGEIITIAEKRGFDSEAERFIDDIYDEEKDDVDNIELILNKAKECWLDYLEAECDTHWQFTINANNYSKDEFVISVAYIL